MTSMASWGVTFLAMLRSAVATASSAWVGTRDIGRGGKPTDRVAHVFVHHVGCLVLKRQ